MLFAVIPTYLRGQRLSDAEIEGAQPLVGDLNIDETAERPDGNVRRKATLMSGSRLLLEPIVDPRITGMSPLRFGLRGLEALEIPRGTRYVLQEWLVEERNGSRRPGRPRASELLPNPQAQA